MAAKSSGSGLDDLMRLSQQFKNQAHEAKQREKQTARQRQKSQDVFSELRALSISVAAKQLQSLAPAETIRQVNALKNKPGTAELLKLIDNLIFDLEKQVSKAAMANPGIKPIERSIKTLAILLGLLSSLSS
ncbi:MAG: hypothetical protein PHN78_00320 [Dehalococcoidales bacterium]|nr:hypothetical protein [Dehalococcoidales bacterium]